MNRGCPGSGPRECFLVYGVEVAILRPGKHESGINENHVNTRWRLKSRSVEPVRLLRE